MRDRVTIQDCRDAGFCVSGIRAVCETHGLDFRALVRAGLPLEPLKDIDDLTVKRVVRIAEERTNG